MESWKELARPHNFEDPGDSRGWYALRTRLDPSTNAHVSQEQTRHLVFVGHSYGGLVIKRVRLSSSIRKERGLTLSDSTLSTSLLELTIPGAYTGEHESIIRQYCRLHKNRLLLGHPSPRLKLQHMGKHRCSSAPTARIEPVASPRSSVRLSPPAGSA